MTPEDVLAMKIGDSATRLRDLVGLSEDEIQAAMAAAILVSGPMWDSMYCDTYLRGRKILHHVLHTHRTPWDTQVRAEVERLDDLLVQLYKLVSLKPE